MCSKTVPKLQESIRLEQFYFGEKNIYKLNYIFKNWTILCKSKIYVHACKLVTNTFSP